jgi:hypothetical protein
MPKRQHAKSPNGLRLIRPATARAAFFDAHPDVLDRLGELNRAVESERAADRRLQAAARGVGRPIAFGRSAAVAYEPCASLVRLYGYGPDL